MGIAATIGNERIVLHKNAKEHTPTGEYAPRSMAKKVIDWIETGEGTFRSMQLCDRIFSFVNAVNPHPALSGAAKVFRGCWTMVPHWPKAIQEAKESIAEARETSATPEIAKRKTFDAIHDTASAVSLPLYFFSSFMPFFKATAGAVFPVVKAADTLTFAGDTIDLKHQVEDFGKARSLVGRAKAVNVDPVLQEKYGQSQTYYMLKMMKAVCSVAGFVLGLGLMATGTATLPGLVILAASISLLGATLATSASLYSAGMPEQPIKFFNDKHVMPIVPAKI